MSAEWPPFPVVQDDAVQKGVQHSPNASAKSSRSSHKSTAAMPADVGEVADGISAPLEQQPQPELVEFYARDQLALSELMLQDNLGSGSQGEVFRAIWWRSFTTCTSAITVAVKRFHSHVGQKFFCSEALMHQINHPNLVKCFDATAEPPYLIVSEYCAGGSLYNLLHETAVDLTWCQRLTILCEIAQGMEHLHGLVPKVLHRDLKSCNVLLTTSITSQHRSRWLRSQTLGLPVRSKAHRRS